MPSSPELADMTFGVPDTFFWNDCSPGIAEAVHKAIRQLEAAGTRIVTVNLPNTDEAYQLFQQGGLAASELVAFLNTELPDMIDALDPNVAARIKAADDIAAWEYVRRRNVIEALSASAGEQLSHIDALLTPTVAITPPTLDSLLPDGAYLEANMLALRNTVMANFMGLCALTLPVGKDAAGMPVGLQLLAGPWQEARLLAMGQAIEAKLGNSLAILGQPPTPSAV